MDFQGDESYSGAPAVISVSICPSVFSFMVHPNKMRKFFVRVSNANLHWEFALWCKTVAELEFGTVKHSLLR